MVEPGAEGPGPGLSVWRGGAVEGAVEGAWRGLWGGRGGGHGLAGTEVAAWVRARLGGGAKCFLVAPSRSPVLPAQPKLGIPNWKVPREQTEFPVPWGHR